MIRILPYGKVSTEEIFSRCEAVASVGPAVAEIIVAVRKDGDAALRYYAEKFDKAALTEIEVPQETLDAAVEALDSELRQVLTEAAERIRNFHRRQVRNSFVISEEEGILLGQKVIPMDRVGLYIPGGTAAYPSSVLMNAIPASVASALSSPVMLEIRSPRTWKY